MPERYDLSACANELMLRNTVIARMRGGWEVAPAFRLPETVADTTRIGRDKELTYTRMVCGLIITGLIRDALFTNCPDTPDGGPACSVRNTGVSSRGEYRPNDTQGILLLSQPLAASKVGFKPYRG